MLFWDTFRIIINHKPLIGLFGPMKLTTFKRWSLPVSAYDYTSEYKLGSGIFTADRMSLSSSTTPICIIYSIDSLDSFTVDSIYIRVHIRKYHILSNVVQVIRLERENASHDVMIFIFMWHWKLVKCGKRASNLGLSNGGSPQFQTASLKWTSRIPLNMSALSRNYVC